MLHALLAAQQDTAALSAVEGEAVAVELQLTAGDAVGISQGLL